MALESLKKMYDTHKTTLRGSTSWVTILAIVLCLLPLITLLGWILEQVYHKQKFLPQAFFHPEYWIDKLISRLPGCIVKCCRTCRVDEEAPIENRSGLKTFDKSKNTDIAGNKVLCTKPSDSEIKVDKTKLDENKYEQFSSSESTQTEHIISNDQVLPSKMRKSKLKSERPYDQLTSSESQHVCIKDKDTGDQFSSSDSDTQTHKNDTVTCGQGDLPKNYGKICNKKNLLDLDTHIQKKDNDTSGFNEDWKQSESKKDKRTIHDKICLSDSDIHINKAKNVTSGPNEDLKQNVPRKDKRTLEQISSSDSETHIRKTEKDTCGFQDGLKRRDDEKERVPSKNNRDTISVSKKKCPSCKRVYKKQTLTKMRNSGKPRVSEKNKDILRDTDHLSECSHSVESLPTTESTTDSVVSKSPTIKSCLKKPKRERSTDFPIKNSSLNQLQKQDKSSMTDSSTSSQDLRKKKSDAKKPIYKKKQQASTKTLKKPMKKKPISMENKSSSLNQLQKQDKSSMTDLSISSQDLRKKKSNAKKPIYKKKQQASTKTLKKPMNKKPISMEKQLTSITNNEKPKKKKPKYMKRLRSSIWNLKQYSKSSLSSSKSRLSQISAIPNCYLRSARKRPRQKSPHHVNSSSFPGFKRPAKCSSFKVNKIGNFLKSRKSKPKESFCSSISSTISDSLSGVCQLQDKYWEKLKSLNKNKKANKAQILWRKITKKKSYPLCDLVHKFLP